MSVLAWRQWTVRAGTLSALTRLDVWFPGRNEARCPVGAGATAGAAPGAATCGCGFYAYRDPATLWENRVEHNFIVHGIVLGVVELAGWMTEHERGYRAQYGRVVAIAGPEAAQVRPEYEVDRHADFASLVERWWDGDPVDLSEPEPETTGWQPAGPGVWIAKGTGPLGTYAIPPAPFVVAHIEVSTEKSGYVLTATESKRPINPIAIVTATEPNTPKSGRYVDDRPRWQSPYGPKGKRR